MKKIRTVKLEFLRSGPPHNQLLSPLTVYLATAGRHEAVTVRVPYEHQSFLARLQFLSYRYEQNEHHQQTLREVARDISLILGDIPGLNGDLAATQSDPDTLVHLRLVFSASELALLPFEMGNAPTGFPGEGRPISLQLTTPLVITREIRNAQGFKSDWTKRPKILFAYAEPPGVGTVPFKAHLLALRKAIDPWLKAKKKGQTDKKRLDEYLHVLPNANLEQIQKACKANPFTHVHILAHGISVPSQKGRFGLALHDSYDPKRIDGVDGERLANALRCHRCGQEGLSQPNVVTLASCDSGQQGSILYPGGSMANALHNEGIPLVIGSQFPLTKRGSVSMVQDFYSKALWGQDPRIILHETRLNLAKFNHKSHDWASLIAFVSLPEQFDLQLKQFRSHQADRAMQVALDWAHYFLERREEFENEFGKNKGEDLLKKLFQRMEKARYLIEESKVSSDSPLEKTIERHYEILGRLGSAEKRSAQIFFNRSRELEIQDQDDDQQPPIVISYKIKFDKAMKDAIGYYRRAFEIKRDNHWGGLQYLSLNMIYQFWQNHELSFPFELWEHIFQVATAQTKKGSLEEKAWAHLSLAELNLIGLAPEEGKRPSKPKAYVENIEAAKALVGLRSYHCYTSMFQFRRYTKGHFLHFNDSVAEAAKQAEKLVTPPKDYKPNYPNFPSA